jgi:transmembrane sensor
MATTTSNSSLRRQIVSEACEWFTEFRTGDATATTRERFDEWLRQSPEHIQAYLEVASAWAELPTQVAAGRLDIEALVQRARASASDDVVVSLKARGGPTQGLMEAAPSKQRRRFLTPRALAAGIAAALLVASAVGWFSWRGPETYTTAVGEQRTIRLADDSIVDLNARSSIKVRFSNSERVIDLMEGQAMFHVARDPSRPFIVRSDNTAVRAVGTQFDVYRKDDGLVVTVVEGRVAVIPPPVAPPATSGPTLAAATAQYAEILSAGEQLTVTPKAAARKPHHADVEAATAWVQRRLVFDDTPLAEVAEEFNRYSIRRLVIDDAELSRKTLSGAYSSSDPASLIGFLRSQPTLEVTETDREIRVTRRGAAGTSSPQ